MHEGGKKAIVAAFLANLGIAVSKFVVFLITGAASMLAESIHSLADTGNQGLLMLGGSRARRPPDEAHPFGYGPLRYFWAFVVALVLFTLGGLFAVYEGVDKLRHPHELEKPAWAIGVLVVAVVLESLSFRTAIREARPLRRGRSWWQFIRHSKSPELPVVLLEDLGALCGLFIALIGVILAIVTDEARFDAAGSLGIGVLLVALAGVLAVEMSSLLIGESADPHDQAAIRDAMVSHRSVARVIHLRTEHVGPEEIVVAAKLEFDVGMSIPQLAAAIDEIEVGIRAAVPNATLIFLEPDLYRPV